jgi:hypothetical protein
MLALSYSKSIYQFPVELLDIWLLESLYSCNRRIPEIRNGLLSVPRRPICSYLKLPLHLRRLFKFKGYPGGCKVYLRQSLPFCGRSTNALAVEGNEFLVLRIHHLRPGFKSAKGDDHPNRLGRLIADMHRELGLIARLLGLLNFFRRAIQLLGKLCGITRRYPPIHFVAVEAMMEAWSLRSSCPSVWKDRISPTLYFRP